jgi:Mg-chelatase subunit ChlD
MRFQGIFALYFLVFISTLSFGSASAATNVLFILDSSGSMWEQVEGIPKIVIAKRVLNDTLSALPSDTRLGLMTYGHRRKGDCKDIEMLSPIGAAKSAEIAAKVRALTPKGETPIAAALLQAAGVLKTFSSDHNHIVLITDGAEECRGDPCAAARELAAAGLDVHVNVVGFNLKQKERDAVACIAREGHGKYYDAKDQKSLSAAMVEVKQEVVSQAPAAAKPPEEFNLLLAANGGQLIAAPSENWANAISGKDGDSVRLGGGDEAVFAFKDGKPATFSKFSILIAAASGGNIKDFELFAANDAPTGVFRSLGRFATQNLRLIKLPYQEFTFPETTAKYLKIKVLSNHGGYPLRDADLTQIRLIGKLAQEAATPAAIKPPEEFNLLLAANGGRFVAGANQNWANAITGKDGDTVRLGAGEEAVFAFKDGKAATFSKFSILIAATSGGNIKDFELLAADDAPTGAFRSLGRFSTQNVRLIKSPYQEFAFPETTAKYLKIKVLSNHGGYPLRDADLTQVRLGRKPAN